VNIGTNLYTIPVRTGVCMTWKNVLKNNVTTLEQLKKYVDLSPEEQKRLKGVIERHPMSITRYYLSLIDWSNPNDPLKKMVVPSVEELNLSGSYDTSGERGNTKMPGLQHKYSQTALILATNKCATYCRYCFRKRLVGLPTEEVIHRFSMAVNYIKKHTEINNVLISGGDPFTLSTAVIEKFLEKLAVIPHLDFIRFGTRIPVTFPERILDDKDLLKLLERYAFRNKKIYIVAQFNHPKEITDMSKDAVDMLTRSGIIVNNQSVLLKGVNDNPDILVGLQNKLVGIGVNPYYVFQCRPVKRVKQQFTIPLYKGYWVVEEAKKKLNGHSKRFKYVMSHRTGKIEIIGIMNDEIYLKYNQAENDKNIGKFFKKKLNKTAAWLDDLH